MTILVMYLNDNCMKNESCKERKSRPISRSQYLYLPIAVVAVEGAPVAADSPHDDAGAGAVGGSDDASGVLAPAASPPPLLTSITVRRTRMARPRPRRLMNLMGECIDMLFNFTSTFLRH